MERKSYIKNCLIKSRNEEALFFVNKDSGVEAFLDGYAIIPREDYDELIKNKDKK